MNRPAPPESETPEMTLVEHLRDEAKVADNLSHWHTRDLLLRAATALSLAQTEIKGHMRVKALLGEARNYLEGLEISDRIDAAL
jgi:hypothetical protein